jgi:hypothetical protein
MKLSHSLKGPMLEHIYPICLKYFSLLGSMPHCSRLILILIFILSSKRAKWNCHLSFYNLRDQLLPSIYPSLQNRCLANLSLLVSKDMSYVPVAWQWPGWNIHISSGISALLSECHMHVFECNVVSEFQSNRWRTSWNLRFCTNEHLHFYLYI